MTPERIVELRALRDRVAFTQSQEAHYDDDYCRSARMMAIETYKHRLFQYSDDLLATAEQSQLHCPACKGSGEMGIGCDGEVNECHYCDDGQITAAEFIRQRDTLEERIGDCTAHQAIVEEKDVEIARLRAYAEAVAEWEAALILSQEAWGGGMREYPQFTSDLYDRWMELQAMRNAALDNERR